MRTMKSVSALLPMLSIELANWVKRWKIQVTHYILGLLMLAPMTLKQRLGPGGVVVVRLLVENDKWPDRM